MTTEPRPATPRRRWWATPVAHVAYDAVFVAAFLAYLFTGGVWDTAVGQFLAGATVSVAVKRLYLGWRHFADQGPDR